MVKVEVFCNIRKKMIKVDKKLADALVKMKRASYDTKVETVYPNKMMVADVKPVSTEAKPVIEEKPVKRRGRKKKDEDIVETETVDDADVQIDEETVVADVQIDEETQRQIEELNKLMVQNTD